MITSLLKRELIIATHQPRNFVFTLAFIIFCGFMFPFAIGPESETLNRYGPGIIWLLNLFVISLNLSSFYSQDEQDGCLEQLLATLNHGSFIFLSKALSQTLLIGNLSIVGSLLLSFWFNLNQGVTTILISTLIIGVPGIIFLGGLCSTLTLSSKSSTFLHSLIMFPLCIPLLIFSIGALESALLSQSPLPFLKIEAAISLLFILSATYISSKVLENSL